MSRWTVGEVLSLVRGKDEPLDTPGRGHAVPFIRKVVDAELKELALESDGVTVRYFTSRGVKLNLAIDQSTGEKYATLPEDVRRVRSVTPWVEMQPNTPPARILEPEEWHWNQTIELEQGSTESPACKIEGEILTFAPVSYDAIRVTYLRWPADIPSDNSADGDAIDLPTAHVPKLIRRSRAMLRRGETETPEPDRTQLHVQAHGATEQEILRRRTGV